MSKIGIMGGTFNPIHDGHVGIAKAAYEQYDLDEVWFMPNHIPAYKNEKEVLNGDTRMEMIRLAIKKYPYFSTSDYELKRNGKTYTYETLKDLYGDYPEHSFYFIMGADSLFYFQEWKHPEIIVKYVNILVATRDDKGNKEIQNKINQLNQYYGDEIFYAIITPDYPCSSSQIRKVISKLQHNIMSLDDFSSQYHISKDVYQYIIDNNLYKNE